MNSWARALFPIVCGAALGAAGIFYSSPSFADSPAAHLNEPLPSDSAARTEPLYEPLRGDRVEPPRPEADRGPPPFERAPLRARRSVEIVPELALGLPSCRSGAGAAACTSLGPALGGGLGGLYRATPYFAFGVFASYGRATGRLATRDELELRRYGVAGLGRVYLEEDGVFDPYLELELGYADVRTSFEPAPGLREEHAAFGPSARVGGGLEFLVHESLRLGAAAGFAHFVLARGEHCQASRCVAGGAPGGAATGGLFLSLRAAVLFGDLH